MGVTFLDNLFTGEKMSNIAHLEIFWTISYIAALEIAHVWI